MVFLKDWIIHHILEEDRAPLADSRSTERREAGRRKPKTRREELLLISLSDSITS